MHLFPRNLHEISSIHFHSGKSVSKKFSQQVGRELNFESLQATRYQILKEALGQKSSGFLCKHNYRNILHPHITIFIKINYANK